VCYDKLHISKVLTSLAIFLMRLADDRIAEMERHLKTLSEKLKLMKASKKKDKSEKKPVAKLAPEKAIKPKVASKTTPQKAPPKPVPAKAPIPEKKKTPVKRSRPVYSSSSDSSSSSSEEDVPSVTFEQKKELSEAINNFEGDKLANVVQIIHSSMPHLRDVSVHTYSGFRVLSFSSERPELTCIFHSFAP